MTMAFDIVILSEAKDLHPFNGKRSFVANNAPQDDRL
jgi:hypothetical protein